ncbi:MAG: pilus assembly protein PilP [Acidobacteria bacterium]|nr:pilus assembly protein PilP [Acidobacteriota bacterium]
MKRLFSFVILLMLMTAPGFSQQNGKTEKKKSEEISVEGESRYIPKSNRDPFVSPFDLERLKGKKNRRPGIRGMAINEIVIQGIIKSKKRGYEALVLGSDNKIYWIKPGDELYDGRVLSIGVSVDKKTGKQVEKVVFRQDIDDPSQLLPYRDITKYLNK